MKIYKVLPDLSKKRQMHLWHTALRSQWSAEDVDWSKPQGFRRSGMKDQLAQVLTPVLIGEQSALYSVSGLIPILGGRSEVESQFYLTTWAVDEARHTELFARMFRRIDREPMSIRQLPEGYLFQSAIVSDEPAEWLAGVLVSEVMATRIMEEFRRLDLDPVLSDIADGILDDEARHLGFNHMYLEDRFASLYKEDGQDGGEGAALLERLRRRVDLVLGKLPPVLDRLHREFVDLGMEPERLLFEVEREAHRRLGRSAKAGLRVAKQGLARESTQDQPGWSGSGREGAADRARGRESVATEHVDQAVGAVRWNGEQQAARGLRVEGQLDP